jgi:uncharacterized membrane protein YfcA
VTVVQAIILFGAALLGGALNAVAGGGSFIGFPALLLTGVAPINANATNTVALWPGSVASIGAYRGALKAERAPLPLLLGASLLGGLLGAIVLLRTPQRTFLGLVPYLLLLATVLFAFGGLITQWVRAHARGGRRAPPWLARLGTGLLQFVIALYGGFFGGGIGILMLSMLTVMGMRNIHAMNALKAILTTAINGVAVVAFVVAGAVVWPQALVMVAGAIIGGYGGGAVARRIDQRLVRRFVIVVGCVMTAYFFIRQYA